MMVFARKYAAVGAIILVGVVVYWVMAHPVQQSNDGSRKDRVTRFEGDTQQRVVQHPPDGVREISDGDGLPVSLSEKQSILRVARGFSRQYVRFLSGKRVRSFSRVTPRLQKQLSVYHPRFTPVRRVARLKRIEIRQARSTHAIVHLVVEWNDQILTRTPVGLCRKARGRWFVCEVGEGR